MKGSVSVKKRECEEMASTEVLLPRNSNQSESGSEKIIPNSGSRKCVCKSKSALAGQFLDFSMGIIRGVGILAMISTLLWFHVRLTLVETGMRTVAEGYLKSGIGNDNFGLGFGLVEEFNPKEYLNDISEAALGKEYQPMQPPSGKRTKRRVDQSGRDGKSKSHHISPKSGSSISGSHVEFFDPRLKEEIERNGGPGGSSSSSGGSESSSNPGVGTDGAWLTAYSKIPVSAMQEFCSGVKDYCPPGVAGIPGVNGVNGQTGSKGERGDPGETGQMGQRGHPGPPGHPGLRGPRGEPGIAGLSGTDGRDGLPGEPGLDGIPGRNGLDGVPGSEGSRGRDGTHGTPGRNGTDGIPGQQGIQGPPGTPGGRGLPGIAGQKGAAGTTGRDGTPGAQTYMYQNLTERGVLVPPAILGLSTRMKPLVVKEEDNVRLRCTATGTPTPRVSWKREDGAVIRLGMWNVESMEGPLLNFTKINREHMGEYICVAGNGITPNAYRSYHVEVHFPPLIIVHNQQVAAVLGSNATLHCDVEAFPEAVTYWESSDEKLITSGEKYKVSTYVHGYYKIRMTLNITRVSQSDLSFYYCVSKNVLQLVKGRLSLSEMDPNQVTPPPHGIIPHGPGISYGKQQPKFEEYLDNCPPAPPPCKECPVRLEPAKCTVGGYYLLDKFLWDINNLGRYYPATVANRTSRSECVLSAVGKGVFYGEIRASQNEGNWMRETYEGNVYGAERYWMTSMAADASGVLEEFANKTGFTERRFSKKYSLSPPFKGNYHTIYNGSFYYIAKPNTMDPEPDEPLRIVRQTLMVPSNTWEMELPYSSFEAETLYSSDSARVAKSWADLSVDENGIWAIYSLKNSNNTAVVKIELEDNGAMNITFGWNITISHKHAGDMFIICGILYAVDSVQDRYTKIRMALDLYKHQLIRVELPFDNPFLKTIMISYNPRTKELFTWDGGNQLIYPVKHAAAGGGSEFPRGSRNDRPFSQSPAQAEEFSNRRLARNSRT